MQTTALPASPTIAVEPIPGNPGYLATIVNGDPETDPQGVGATRLAAALDLARSLLADAHPCACLGIAAVLREEAETLPWPEAHSGMIRAANLVEGIA